MGGTGSVNFRLNMDILRAKAGYGPSLHARWQAIREGTKMADSFDMTLDDPNNLRMIWNNDAFRIKIKKAASLSDEQHVWSRHNFDLAPTFARWLQHKMFSVEDVLSGEVVGFCEVAMLEDPTSSSDDIAMAGIPT